MSPHMDHSHEASPFAILIPLGKLKPQLININTYDTFIVGDLKLPKGSIVLVPVGQRVPSLPSGVEIISYGHLKLRDAVWNTIKEKGGWPIALTFGDPGEIGSLASINKGESGTVRREDILENINTQEFFRPLLDSAPHVSFGHHVKSEKGEAFRFGVIEDAIDLLIKTYSGGFPALSTVLVKFLVDIIEYNLAHLEQYQKKAKLNLIAYKTFERKKTRLLEWLEVPRKDLEVRRKYGKTLSSPNFQMPLNPSTLPRDPLWLSGEAIEVLDEAIEKEKLDPKVLADAFCQQPLSEVQELLSNNPSVLRLTDQTEFWIRYAILRWFIIQTDKADREGIIKILDRSIRTLSRRKKAENRDLLWDVTRLPSLHTNRSSLIDEIEDHVSSVYKRSHKWSPSSSSRGRVASQRDSSGHHRTPGKGGTLRTGAASRTGGVSQLVKRLVSPWLLPLLEWFGGRNVWALSRTARWFAADYDGRLAPVIENSIAFAVMGTLMSHFGMNALTAGLYVWIPFVVLHFVEWGVLRVLGQLFPATFAGRAPPFGNVIDSATIMIFNIGFLAVVPVQLFSSFPTLYYVVYGLVSTGFHLAVNNIRPILEALSRTVVKVVADGTGRHPWTASLLRAFNYVDGMNDEMLVMTQKPSRNEIVGIGQLFVVLLIKNLLFVFALRPIFAHLGFGFGNSVAYSQLSHLLSMGGIVALAISLFTIVLTPIIEEILRAAVLKPVKERVKLGGHGRLYAVALIGHAFFWVWLGHDLYFANLCSDLNMFITFVILGWSYIRYTNIRVPAYVHILNNLSLFMMEFLPAPLSIIILGLFALWSFASLHRYGWLPNHSEGVVPPLLGEMAVARDQSDVVAPLSPSLPPWAGESHFLDAAFLGGPAGSRIIQLTRLQVDARAIRDRALMKRQAALEARAQIEELFSRNDMAPANQVAGLLTQEPQEFVVRKTFIWLAAMQKSGQFFIDEWQKKTERPLDLASMGIAEGRDVEQKIRADIEFVISLLATQMETRPSTEFDRLVEAGIRAFHSAMKIHEGEALVQANLITAKKPLVLELSSTLAQGEIKTGVDRGILRTLVQGANKAASGTRMPMKMTLIVPKETTEDELLEELAKLDPRLRLLAGHIEIVNKESLSLHQSGDQPAQKLSVAKLLIQLEEHKIPTAAGVDLFILNRREWTDPARESLVQMLVILTEDLVYDATVPIDEKVRTLVHIRLQA